jgi:hypothetical protein
VLDNKWKFLFFGIIDSIFPHNNERFCFVIMVFLCSFVHVGFFCHVFLFLQLLYFLAVAKFT